MVHTIVQRYIAAYSGLPRDVWLLAVVLLVNRCGTMVLPFLTLYLTTQMEISEGSAAQMLSLYGAGSILGSYLGGRLSEHWGPFRVQWSCLLLSVPLFLAIPGCGHWWSVAVTLFALATFSEAVRPANNTALARVTTGDNRARAFALQRLAGNLGFSIGPAIGGFLAKAYFVLLFIVDAFTTLGAALVLIYFFRHRHAQKKTANEPTQSTAVVSPLSDRPFVMFLLLLLLTHVVFMQFMTTYPLYLRDHFGLDEAQIGLMFAVNTSIIVLFEMVLVDAIRQSPIMRMIGWGSFLCCMGFGMLPFGSTGLYCLVAMIVVTMGEMLSFPTSVAYVANRSPSGSEGRYMGWYTVTHSVAWVIAPFVGGILYEASPDAVWYSSLVAGVVVFGGFRWLATQG